MARCSSELLWMFQDMALTHVTLRVWWDPTSCPLMTLHTVLNSVFSPAGFTIQPFKLPQKCYHVLPPKMCKQCKCLGKQEDGCTRPFSPVAVMSAALFVANVKTSSTYDTVPAWNRVSTNTMSKNSSFCHYVSMGLSLDQVSVYL